MGVGALPTFSTNYLNKNIIMKPKNITELKKEHELLIRRLTEIAQDNNEIFQQLHNRSIENAKEFDKILGRISEIERHI